MVCPGGETTPQSGRMMHTQTSIFIQGPLSRIVDLAADVERWPQILPHYRWVTLLEGGGDRKVVEMAARRDRIPVRWRAVQEIDRRGATPVIAYRHVWGITRGMDVAWTFAERPDGVNVAIRHDFTPPWPVIGNVIASTIIGPHFVDYIAGRTLSTIKAIVERETVARGGTT
jgi:ribosome-associated toxin RatA of RatAB toxin-antitoxin module